MHIRITDKVTCVQQGIKKEGFHITVTQMCITAVFMALTCVATMVVQIPIPLGYAHLGDSVILICAFFFGPVVGALAGGIGSAMADILTGFAVWAVPTLIIKTIMPIIACAIFGNMKSKLIYLPSQNQFLLRVRQQLVRRKMHI